MTAVALRAGWNLEGLLFSVSCSGHCKHVLVFLLLFLYLLEVGYLIFVEDFPSHRNWFYLFKFLLHTLVSKIIVAFVFYNCQTALIKVILNFNKSETEGIFSNFLKTSTFPALNLYDVVLQRLTACSYRTTSDILPPKFLKLCRY